MSYDLLWTLGAVAVMSGSWVFAYFTASRHARLVEQRMRQGLEPLGLSVRGRPFGHSAWAEGELLGVPLEVSYTEPPMQVKNEVVVEPQARLRILAGVPGQLPEGLVLRSQDFAQEFLLTLGAREIQIGHEQLDGLLRIQGKDPREVTAVLRSPDVADALLRVAGNTRVDLSLKGQTLEVVQTNTGRIEPAAMVQAVSRLAAALGQAQDAPLRQAVLLRNLTVAAAGPDGGRTLSGRWEGVDLKVQLGFERGSEDRRQTRVLASIEPALPGGLRLRLAGEGGGGLSTGNPILDQLVDVRATDPGAVRALLADEALIEPLMALLHGHPGSYVHPTGLVLVAPGWLTEGLVPAIDLAVEAAQALGRAGEGG